ncbi:MAG TPA: SET domain-containing protein-lysine N-methyltransferase [Chlamydiales bacterium]|nr:SET domain-containing protein-lysine N-methyltransferase [Chlamydiales bacterium]
MSHNCYISDEERGRILAKGHEKLALGQVSLAALELGQRFDRQIEENFLAKVSIRWIGGGIGYGLFAEDTIAVGSFIGEYTGIVRENNLRYLEPLNNYCYEYPILDAIGRSYVIDATRGNFTRFINHSAKPNLQPMYAFRDGAFHCIFLALWGEIQKGEQLSYDYGKSYWYLRQAPEQLL